MFNLSPSCFQIPCTQADIEEVTPVEGDFVTSASGVTEVNSEIQFTCADTSKVPAIKGKSYLSTRCQHGGFFPPLNLPPEDPAEPNSRCVLTCDNFPKIRCGKQRGNICLFCH